MWFASLRTLGMSYRIFLNVNSLALKSGAKMSPLLESVWSTCLRHWPPERPALRETDGAVPAHPWEPRKSSQKQGWLGLPAALSASGACSCGEGPSFRSFSSKHAASEAGSLKPQRLWESPSGLWGFCPGLCPQTSISEASEGVTYSRVLTLWSVGPGVSGTPPGVFEVLIITTYSYNTLFQ